MLHLILALALIAVLYARTISFKNLIDDIVPMKDYLYVVPDGTPPHTFFLQRSRLSARLWAIGVHMLNTALVYLLLGGKAALLFAVHPVAVNNVAWVTGSYYSTTTFLTLTATYFILHVGGWLGAGVAMAVFAAALNSTVVTIAFPFVWLFGTPLGLCSLAPLGMFLVGKRFKTGIAIRNRLQTSAKKARDQFTWRRLVVMTKVVAKYLFTALVPYTMCFFHSMGDGFTICPEKRRRLEALDGTFYASLGLIISFVAAGYALGVGFWVMWFLVLIAAFSQYRILGQFYAERYIYPTLVGIVALLALLPTELYWMLVGVYVMRTFIHIPTFKDNHALYENGTKMDPVCTTNYLNLSDWYMFVEQDLNLAYSVLQKVLRLQPNSWVAHMNLSTFFVLCRDYSKALENIDKAKGLAEGIAIGHMCELIEKQRETCLKMMEPANEPEQIVTA